MQTMHNIYQCVVFKNKVIWTFRQLLLLIFRLDYAMTLELQRYVKLLHFFTKFKKMYACFCFDFVKQSEKHSYETKKLFDACSRK